MTQKRAKRTEKHQELPYTFTSKISVNTLFKMTQVSRTNNVIFQTVPVFNDVIRKKEKEIICPSKLWSNFGNITMDEIANSKPEKRMNILVHEIMNHFLKRKINLYRKRSAESESRLKNLNLS